MTSVALRVHAFVQIAGLVVLAPLALFPTPGRSIALAAIPGLWLCRWLVARTACASARTAHTSNGMTDYASRITSSAHFIPRTPLDAPILLLAVMILVSLYATYDILVSLPKIAGLVYGIAVYYAVVETLSSRARLAWGLGLYLALGVGLAALALVGTNWTPKSPSLALLAERLPAIVRGLPGAEAGFHPNEVAGALLWFIPLALGVCAASLVHGASLKGRGAARLYARLLSGFRDLGFGIWSLRLAVAALTLLFLAATLLLTQSRGALLGLAVGLLVMLACLGWPGRGAALAAVASAAWGVWRVGLSHLGEILFGGQSVEAVGAINLAGRVEIWSRAIYAIQDFPISGMGLNTFRTVVHVLYPLFLISPNTDIAHAHNHFLQAALDLGIPGLIAYAALWIAAGVLLAQVWRAARDPWLRAVALGVGGSLTAYFVFGLADAVALGAKPGLAFWLLLALGVSLWKVSGREQRHPA